MGRNKPIRTPEVSDNIDQGLAPICVDCDGLVDAKNVCEEVRIAEDIHGGLTIE